MTDKRTLVEDARIVAYKFTSRNGVYGRTFAQITIVASIDDDATAPIDDAVMRSIPVELALSGAPAERFARATIEHHVCWPDGPMVTTASVDGKEVEA